MHGGTFRDDDHRVSTTAAAPVRSSAPEPWKRLWSLALVAGFVDTVGFVGLAGLFLAHVTGDMVLVGSDVARRDLSASAPRLVVIVVFILGIAAVARFGPREGIRAVHHLLWTEAALLAIFAVAGVLLVDSPGGAPTTAALLLVAFPGVLAMAVQASLRRIGGGPMTQVMTGNVTTFTFDVVDSLTRRGQAGDDGALRAAVRGGTGLVLSFLLGVILAGVLLPRIGFACVALPCAIVAALAVQASRGSRLKPPLPIPKFPATSTQRST